jgi:alpha-ketoglutarate-dependent taurine dioxygenase
MSIEITLTRAALGADVSGVDLAQPLDDATFARAYNDDGVIFFRNQHIILTWRRNVGPGRAEL